MEKILTIVVPTYNMEKYLDRCLSSLVVDEGRMTLLEVLVVNDGSKDRSSEIAHGYESKYPGTFKVIDKQNGNYGSCINAALPVAQGRYFRILDADDWFDRKDFESLLDFLASSDIDLVFCDYRECHEGFEPILRKMPEQMAPGNVYCPEDFIPFIQDCHFQMHGMNFKTAVLRASGLKLQEGISYTDTEYSFLPLPWVKSMVRLEISPYCYYAGRPGQTMSKESLMKCLPQLKRIAERLILSYEQSDGRFCQSLYLMWQAIIRRVLGVYYSVALVDSKKNAELDARLKSMDSFLAEHPFFDHMADELTLNKLHYVRVWREKGLYNTAPVYKLYNWMWKWLKKVVDLKKSLFS